MSSISRHFLLYNKEGFKSCMDKLTKRYKVVFDIAWGDSQDDVAIVGHDTFPITRYHVDVTFSFEEFIIDGYTYLGCIKDESEMGFITIHGNELTKNMNLSEFINSFDKIPCHNCNRKHSRKIGHLFQIEETGEFIVFGSACAKNYFGINFTRILSFFERITVGVDEWDEDSLITFKKTRVDANTVLKLSYLFCRDYGFVSNTKANENNAGWVEAGKELISTSDDVKITLDNSLTSLTPKQQKDHKEMDIDFSVITEKFIDTDKPLSDYEHNVITVQEKIKNNATTVSDIGMIAYLVYDKFFKVTVEKTEYTLPEWDKGYKLQKLNVKLINTHSFEGYYGTTNIYTFLTEDNVRLQWFTSINLTHRFDSVEINDMFVLNASVKELKDDKYGKSVVITRTKLKK